MVTSHLKALPHGAHGGRWGRSLYNFDRIIVFSGTICATLIALLLQQLLGLGVRKAQQQLHIVMLHGDVVELGQHSLGDITGFEAMYSNIQFKDYDQDWVMFILLPSEANLLAHASFLVSADLLRHNLVGLKVTSQIL